MTDPSPYRFLPLGPDNLAPDAERRYDRWLLELDEELSDPSCDRDRFCRRVLGQIFLSPDLALEEGARAKVSLGRRVALDQLDPRNVTLEPEYYPDIELARYRHVKPLIWLWEMFDKSVLGENVYLGVKFRRMLAKRIFSRCGRNFKAFHSVKFTFGYKIEVGDDVVIHRHVLLDDRGGIRIGDGVSISDYANVYSHSHHVAEPREVTAPRTVIGHRVRVAYHATVLAGVQLAPNSMVGAGALVTRDTEADTVHVGLPAKAVKRKPQHRRRSPTADPLAEA